MKSVADPRAAARADCNKTSEKAQPRLPQLHLIALSRLAELE